MGTAARQVRLFLIRHGETVDNVAQVYAGSRDSELTNHGYQQATRLGLHFSARGLVFTHIFSSHLQRAAKTAGLIREAQITPPVGDGSARTVPDIVQLPVLMEQDFGFFEGKKWYERPPDSKLTGKEQHREEHKDTAGFVDIESKESLAQRADAFLDGHLLPLLDATTESAHRVVAVVSHGIMLSSLWKRLLLRLPPKSVAFSPGLSESVRNRPLEHLGGWSNTGYLELHLTRTEAVTASAANKELQADPIVSSAPSSTTPAEVGSDSPPTESLPSASTPLVDNPAVDGSTQIAASSVQSSPARHASGWTTVIQTMNGRDHLKGLKRTGGGVGSAKHDASQKNIDSFFKRRKIE
ncbi:histidine phosphatase superfamily [Lophiotrema nucula]|uniref:Histidine phosphatase superfamily n=1 Tax=Lophiotrema nucula TaxID=690887 RepID=A0A6A5YEK8_9PLEO|nr:histidine phosphatase superfamily [Lophiotrema nucula]